MKYWLPLLLLATLLAGFFVVLQKLSDIEQKLENISLPVSTSTLPLPEIVLETPTSSNAGALRIVTIPTTIIFRALSSPRLSPQTNLAVILESVSKNPEGRVGVHFKTFTSEAESYTSLELQNLFEIVNLSSGINLRPTDILGSFNSIPPKSAVSGSVTFQVPADQRSIILQINAGENPVFYRFYFDEKRYEETTIG